jgi:flagellum-specific peptidoglycan hydrolase FlgJ
MLDENVYSWADGGYGNRNLITIEIAESDFMKYTAGASFKVTNPKAFKADIIRGYETAVLLCANICKRHKWNPLAKLASGLYLISSHNEGRAAGLSTPHVDPDHVWREIGKNMTIFRQDVVDCMKGGSFNSSVDWVDSWYRIRKNWKDPESQLGAYETIAAAKTACPYGYSVFDSTGKLVYKNNKRVDGTVANDFLHMTENDAAEKILEMVHNCDHSGIFYSVTAAQMILESGYVTTELSKIANNCFGMKAMLSGNTWEGSTWDGKSSVDILTHEVYGGNDTVVEAKFRKYLRIEDSIKDHAAYLLGAMNGDKKRYEGLLNTANAEQAIRLIKKGGYATDPKYVDKIMSLIRRYSLDRFDNEIHQVSAKITNSSKPYRVQVGAYKDKKLAKNQVAAVKALGFPARKIEENGYFVVVSSYFKNEENAQKRVADLKSSGIEAFVKRI